MYKSRYFGPAHVRRHRTVALLLALMMGCATTDDQRLGSFVGPLPADVDEEVLEGGAVAEALLALSRMRAVASGVREVGARLSFTFWSERGALTLTGYSASGRSGVPGQFQRWYHRADGSPGAGPTIDEAEKAAVNALERLFPR